jgi:Tol biopolymer transport system component
MRWLAIPLFFLLCACSTTREITISARPPDAMISVDNGAQSGMGQITATVVFKNADDVHMVAATRRGYQDKTISLHRDDKANNVEIDLDPFHKHLTFTTVPIPADVYVNGTPITTGPSSQAATTLNFTLDDKDQWTKYEVVAQRQGWDPAKIDVTWTDPSSDYVLQLQAKHKDVTITTNPPGATVSVDDTPVGAAPAVAKGLTFPFDTSLNAYPEKKVTVSKPGYDPVDKEISWDDGKTNYEVDLVPHTKIVRIITDPPGATVVVDGKPADAGPDGVATIQLSYVPINDAGDLPAFNATINKKTSETEWYPLTMPIPWDEGRSEYSATLREIMTRHVSLTSLDFVRDDDGAWQAAPSISDTIAMKDVSEGPGKDPPTQLFQSPKGSCIGTLAMNPNGGQIVFTVYSGSTRNDFRSQILAVDTGGSGAVQELTDGKSIDLMPSFTPDGTQIVYSSNRAGRHFNVWRKNVDGTGGIDQLTYFNEQDLWPTIDSFPKPRLFYEVRSDSLPDPQLYMAPVDSNQRTDLTPLPVRQPRVSPRADSLLYTAVNERTGNREIYRISDRGGMPMDITNDPDSQCYDPCWSKDGSMMAYVSDRGMATYPVLQDNRIVDMRTHDADIWIVDLSPTDHPEQITTNGSVDDNPVWDPGGTFIYFRSNRGGQWAIWKIGVK